MCFVFIRVPYQPVTTCTKDGTLSPDKGRTETCPLCWNINRPSNLKTTRKSPNFNTTTDPHPRPLLSSWKEGETRNFQLLCKRFVWCFVILQNLLIWLMNRCQHRLSPPPASHQNSKASPMPCQWTARLVNKFDGCVYLDSPEKWLNTQWCLRTPDCSL